MWDVAFVAVCVQGKVVNYEEEGGVADDFGLETAWNNGRIMNQTLNSLQQGQNKFKQAKRLKSRERRPDG